MIEHIDGGDGVTDHTDVGAYALGLLEDEDARAFEVHLAGCEQCTDELNGFSGMRELLTGLGGPVELDEHDHPPVRPAGPDDTGDVIGLLRRRKAVARRQRRGTAIIGAAAGIALLAGGVTIGATVVGNGAYAGHDHGNVPGDLLAWGETRRASDATTGVSGIIAMENKQWGTHLALDLTHISGPRTCELVAISKSGVRHVVTEWAVSPSGYGMPGSSTDHLQVHGGTALRKADVERFEVTDQKGGTLLTIPV